MKRLHGKMGKLVSKYLIQISSVFVDFRNVDESKHITGNKKISSH